MYHVVEERKINDTVESELSSGQVNRFVSLNKINRPRGDYDHFSYQYDSTLNLATTSL
jgi:hypothetical protein